MFTFLACVAAFAKVATGFAIANAEVLNANADRASETVANSAALNHRCNPRRDRFKSTMMYTRE